MDLPCQCMHYHRFSKLTIASWVLVRVRLPLGAVPNAMLPLHGSLPSVRLIAMHSLHCARALHWSIAAAVTLVTTTPGPTREWIALS
jgi:hypothetical protein